MKKGIIVCLAVGTLVTGCTNTTSEKNYTAKGAATGFLGGAVAGAALSDNPLKGALIGAFAGVIAGGLIGNYMDKQYNDLIAVQKKHSDLFGTVVQSNKGATNETVMLPVAADSLFVGNTTDLKPDAKIKLDEALVVLKSSNEGKIYINSFTDSIGDKANALKITSERAEAIRNYAVNQGVNQERIIAKGYGQSKPVATNETVEGRKLNRRVEIVVAKV